MKTARTFVLAALVPTFLAATLLAGCTLIGGLIGGSIDTNSGEYVRVSAWKLDSLSPGQEVSVLLSDGREYSNATLQLALDSLDAYQKRFAEFAQNANIPLLYPRLGDSIYVTTRTGFTYPARLLTYDYGTVHLKPDTLPPVNIRYASIRFLDMKGTRMTGDDLTDAVRRYSIPIRSSLVIADKATGTPLAKVSPSGVQSILYKESSSAWVAGMLIGAAVDATIIVLATSASEPEKKVMTTTGKGSCPFVYSYDGSDYVMDSETFSGAIFRSLQRTDCDNLEHLADVDGTCRIKIANKMSETQYVDQLKVNVIDHPRSVEILPRSPGVVWTIANPRSPLSAVSSSSHLVTRLVEARDSLVWVSNPTGRNPNDVSSVRDGMVLVFDRPADAPKVKLVFRVQNTPWALEMEERLLRLQGTDLRRWYEAMNASSDLRNGFVEAVKREAMLMVQLWDGVGWLTIDHIPFVGPFIDKSLVVVSDLKGTPERELRVRIESTAGLWMVNSVQADFSDEVPVQIAEATPIGAVDRAGKDQRVPMLGVDGEYYVLRQGDEAELTFTVPVKRPGLVRSFVLESTGYYVMDIDAAGAPRRDLVNWIGNEPGAFGQYSTSIFNAWLGGTSAPGQR